MVTLDNVYFQYPKSDRNVIAGATASFSSGMLYAITGPSGVGKSTLLSLLAGIDFPQSGEVRIDGKPVKKDAIREHNISFVFQNFLLFSNLSALENVELAMDIRDAKMQSKREMALQLLQNMGLSEADARRKVKKLSGGEQQRVAIARALAVGSNIILADEPTGNLDRENAEKIISLLQNIAHAENKCVIVTTHSEQVRKCADRSFALLDGVLVEGGAG